MRLSWEPLTLDLKTTFRIAHGASDQRHNVLVRLDEGLGEAAAVPYYGESQQGIIEYLKCVPDLGDDPFDIEGILARRPPGSRAARCAIDEALHDLWGKQLGQPLYRLFGLSPSVLPLTSFTIGMDAPEVMAERARDSGWPVIKVKLGGAADEACVSAVRKATDARLRVDANAGWTREQALELIPRLAEYDLEFIEQPLAVDDVEGFFWLKGKLRRQNVTIPIFYSKGGGVLGPPLDVMIHYLTPEFLCLVLVAVPTALWLLATKRDLASIFVALLVPAAWLGVWMPGKYFPHYFIQLFPFLALLAGIGAAQVFSRRRVLLAVVGPVIVAAFLYYPYKEHDFFHTYTPEEVSMIKYGNVFADSVYVAKYLRERTIPSDCIFQWGFEPELYFLTDRPTITPYISSTIFANLREPKPAILSLIDSLNRRKPKYIIVQPEWAEWLGVNELSELVQRDYDLETRLRYAFIYRRRSS